MKGLVSVVTAILQDGSSRGNLKSMLRLLAVLFGLVALFSVLFHVIMRYEGKEQSWISGVYWTMTVMATLGCGDITFHSDLGRMFSVIVLLPGVIYLLVLLPFTFIEFFYALWMRAQAAARAPRELPASVRDHVVLTHHDAVASALSPMLEKYGQPRP
jgi:voltage-gated potassium channel